MIALCGVFKALKDSGIIEMCTYIAGLSGSTWFVSQLYTHPEFPDVPTDEVLDYFRQRTGLGLLSHLGAPTLMRSVFAPGHTELYVFTGRGALSKQSDCLPPETTRQILAGTEVGRLT